MSPNSKLPLMVGNVVEISLPVRGREIACDAEVLDIRFDSFLVTAPRRKGVLIPIEVDSAAVSLNTAECTFTMRCSLTVLAPDLISLGFPSQDAVERVQRRQFLRVRTRNLPCVIEVDPGAGEVCGTFDAALSDLSGGGCAILLNEAVSRGTLARLSLELPGEGYLSMWVRVMRSMFVKTPIGAAYQLSLEFERISEIVRGKVIRFVFACQRDSNVRVPSPRGTKPLELPPA